MGGNCPSTEFAGASVARSHPVLDKNIGLLHISRQEGMMIHEGLKESFAGSLHHQPVRTLDMA